jgi:SAM-dependent methyltransferase
MSQDGGMDAAGAGTGPYTVDWGEQAGALGSAADQEREWYAAVAAALLRPGDRVAVDVGCGGGGMAAALAAALGPGGLVVAADGSAEVLAEARRRLDGTPARVELVVADLDAGVGPVRVAAGGPADVVWASASVHHAGDQQAAVTALAGLLGPGGRLALAEGGLPPSRLPWDLGVGEPGLEVRLEAAQDRWFARMRAELPGSVPMPYGWTEALRRAGLTGVTSRSTLLERPVPLSAEDRAWVVAKLAHRLDWLRPTGLLEPADLATWDRLLDPADPVHLGGRADLHFLEARTVHLGTRPA